MKFSPVLLILFVSIFLSFISCTSSDSNRKNLSNEYLQQLDSARSQISFEDRVTYLQLVGLFPLESLKPTSFGASPSNTHSLDIEGIPETIGEFEILGDSVLFHASSGVDVTDSDLDTIHTIRLALNQYGNSEMLNHGRLKWMIKSFQDKRYIRIWDLQNPHVKAFKGYEWYPPKAEFRLEANYMPYVVPRKILVPTSMQTSDEVSFVGEIQFQYRGDNYHLNVQEGGFLMFADETSGQSTYGSGRYLDLNLPEQGGTFILDFNLAYNPPCSFSSYTTCRFPPRENRLPFRVESGEQYAHSTP